MSSFHRTCLGYGCFISFTLSCLVLMKAAAIPTIVLALVRTRGRFDGLSKDREAYPQNYDLFHKDTGQANYPSGFIDWADVLHPDLDQSDGLAFDLNLTIDAMRSLNEHSVDQSGEEEISTNLGSSNHVCSFCSVHMWFEERLIRPSTTQNLKFSLCCVEGKVWLHPFREIPSPLSFLLDYKRGGLAKCFRENIRLYNSLFEFTSIGRKVDDEINRRPGPYVFRLCGQNHHKIGSLLPVDGASPKFSQLHIYDIANELSNRMFVFASTTGPKPQEDIFNQLIKMFN
ncbi:hypothetical protein PTKIN_Ptkin12aG0124300 [Pterospermum kingtungense]